MLAVIKTGGKQYLVSPGQKIKIEKLPNAEGEEILFEEVLLVENEGKVELGKPFLEGAKVKGKVTRQEKGEKIVVFQFKNKKNEKKKKGHRQRFTEVEITSVVLGRT